MREPEIAGPQGAGGTVLVVDSDPEIATLIETYLMRRGFLVYKAYSADEALATAIRVKPQVITLDVILEEGDGFELIQRFKANPETSSIPVVVLSIVCDEGRSCRFGAANYLEKPIDQGRLLDIVSGLVGAADSPLALVVDDDRAVVSLLSETLRRRGFSVATAYDGTEAIAAMEKRVPDVMLLDLRMPKMDGYEVIERVKTHPEWGDTPIVVMTAHPIESANTRLLSEVAGQISKPLSPDGIAAEVERAACRRADGRQRVTRILAVDDEPHILRLVSFSLSSKGFEVIEASDGLTAIEIAEREQPDLILLDVMMPVLDGYEACRRLKANPATQHIPVVMLSAKSQKAEQAVGLEAGAIDYICKPFTPKDLVEQVRGFLGE